MPSDRPHQHRAAATPALPPHELHRLNRRAAWRWGGLVVAFLAGQIVVGGVAIVLATGDPSFAVVPDYHEKAMRWDEAVGAQTASDRLGWKARVELAKSSGPAGERALLVTLADAEGNPIRNAKLQVRVFHHARAGEPIDASFHSHQDGQYTALLPMQRNGLWQIELVATRDSGERFLLTEILETRSGAS